jgi:hypothetical protein
MCERVTFQNFYHINVRNTINPIPIRHGRGGFTPLPPLLLHYLSGMRKSFESWYKRCTVLVYVSLGDERLYANRHLRSAQGLCVCVCVCVYLCVCVRVCVCVCICVCMFICVCMCVYPYIAWGHCEQSHVFPEMCAPSLMSPVSLMALG